MESGGTVTLWIKQVKAGHHGAADDAFRKIWERYSARMAGFARRRLHGRAQAIGDEEDVLQSVFRVAFQRARDGKLDHVDDREDLWKLLIGITAWKARDHVRKHTREKRGGGKVHNEAALGDADSENAGIEGLVVTRLTPELSVLMAEELERLLSLLGCQDDSLRVTAELRMEGADNHEIQEKLGCSERSVERKLKRIRDLWRQELHS